MTNEELKKKIVEILDSLQTHGVRLENIAETGPVKIAQIYTPNDKIADALIAAGIGDVKTAQEIGASATAMAVLEAAKAEHRAARAERALMTVCTNVVKDEEDDLAIEPRVRVLYRAYLKNAEKELAEENE